MPPFKRYPYLLFFALFLLASSGCARFYFHDVGEPAFGVVRYDPVEWPYDEYWTGIVFNGSKVGFTHLSMTQAEDRADRFDIRSQAVLHFRFLTMDKKVLLRSYDRVAEDLTLESFKYDYDIDESRMRLSGTFRDSALEVEVTSKGRTVAQSIPIEGKLYPTSIIGIYPVFHGLEIGRRYRYQVYDGETRSVATVTQEILGYEKSDLFQGNAFRIKTSLHGHDVTTWIDREGKPLLEISLDGVIISELETEAEAKRYQVQAVLNRDETLLYFSLIRPDKPITDPDRVTFMRVVLEGVDDSLAMPQDGLQMCERRDEDIICEIHTQVPGAEDKGYNSYASGEEPYLRATFAVPSGHEMIRRTADEIAGGARTRIERIGLIVQWIQENIRQEPFDVFTALDVLSSRKAECQGHAYLYAAFGRALRIPTRVVNGIVYSREHEGFLYHAWAENLVNGRWIAVDPTLGQVPADATHIKFVEGESMLDLMPLVNLMGRLRVRVVEYTNEAITK